MELNASDDRGIEVVRSKIKAFATMRCVLPEGRHRMVIMDEADRYSCCRRSRRIFLFLISRCCVVLTSMTLPAQQALRRVMELYSGSTRFLLACNNSTKIIDAIQV